MKKTFDNYRRLAKGPWGMSSLWMGDDHLVYVRGNGFILPFTERYSRYRYQDIQYLAITQTSRVGPTVTLTVGFLLFAGIIAGILSSLGGDTPGPGTVVWLAILVGLALFFLVRLIFVRILGPTCHTDLRTNLKRERLLPLGRFHDATKAAELLADVVEKKQGVIFQEYAAADGEINVSELAAASENRTSIAKTVIPAFGNFLGFGVVTLAALHLESIAMWAAALALVVLGGVMLLAAIFRSQRLSSPESIRQLLTWLLTMVMMFGGVALVYFVRVVGSDPAFTASVTGPFEAFAGASHFGGMAFYIAFLATSLSILGLSIAGLVLTLKWQSRIKELAA